MKPAQGSSRTDSPWEVLGKLSLQQAALGSAGRCLWSPGITENLEHSVLLRCHTNTQEW